MLSFLTDVLERYVDELAEDGAAVQGCLMNHLPAELAPLVQEYWRWHPQPLLDLEEQVRVNKMK
jgi:hypothetical protein